MKRQCWITFHIIIVSMVRPGDSAVKMPRRRLNEYISHYESIQYEREQFISNHQRMRSEDTLPLNFKAYGRSFKIILKRDTSLFTHDLHVEQADNFHPFNVYEGNILNEPRSSVHGFVYDGIFEGRIHTQDGNEFHVESVKQHQHLDNKTTHSIMYNVKDIVNKELYKCGGVKAKSMHWHEDYNNTIWSDNVDKEHDPSFFSTSDHHRERRSLPADRKECHLQIRADHTYVAYANNDNNRALYLITQHVKKVSNWYKNTDFNNDGQAEGVTLNIKRIGIIDTSKCSNSDASVNCQFKPSFIGVEKFLDIASLENHNQYCLSYVFCHRDFSNGVLGLAWIGDATSIGGICDKNVRISGVRKSLNTGIVSVLNYGKSVPSRVTDVTFAHEVGHNFGSQHDPRSGRCSPGGSSGNFIMYPRATSGSQDNNQKFSACSMASMWKVIKVRASKCFKRPGEPICGNRVVEKGEQCDCGYEGEPSCQADTCCDGAPTSGFGVGCRYTQKAMRVTSNRCSPSNGICCNGATCRPYDKSSRRLCSKSDDCAGSAICRSSSIDCPKPQTKPDKALCNNNSNTCLKGECVGSLCLLTNKVSCQCRQKADLCHVCCQDKARKQNCTVLVDTNKRVVYRPPGTPCDNYEGYCDILNKCRKVDAEGPLSRLKKLLLSPESFTNMLQWMKTYWWACVLIGLGMIALMVLFVVCCSVHTPSSNPTKPKRRTLTNSRRLTRSTQPAASARNDSGEVSRAPPGYDTAIRGSRRDEPNFEMR